LDGKKVRRLYFCVLYTGNVRFMIFQRAVWSVSDSFASRSTPQGFLLSPLTAKEVGIIVLSALRNTAKSKEALVCVLLCMVIKNDGFSERLSISPEFV
jgi:hypothetical protein